MLSRLISDNTTSYTKHIGIIFLAVVLVNIIFRMFYLEYPSYWYDEIISIKAASEDFGHIKHVSEWDNNPPFYYYCLSVWIKIWNDSEFVSRLLSVLFIAFGGGVLFLFANQHFNKITAIITSLFYLSNNFIYNYSHETRAYALVVLLALLSSYLFFKLKNDLTWKNTVLLSLCNFFLIYTHYIVGLVLVFQWLFVLIWFYKPFIKRYLISTLLIIVLVLLRFSKKQWLLIVGFNKPESKFWLQKSDFDLLYKTLSEFFFQSYFILPFILVIAFGIILFFKLKNQEKWQVYLYSLLLGIGSIVILYFVGKRVSIFLDRYLIFCLPFVFLLIAATISLFRNKIVVIILAVVFSIYSMFHIDFKAEKSMNYREAVTYIKSNTTTADLIIVKTKDMQPLFSYYYEKDYLKEKRKQLQQKNIVFCNAWEDLSVNIGDFKRVIVVDSFYELNPSEHDFVKQLSVSNKLISTNSKYKGIRITEYHKVD